MRRWPEVVGPLLAGKSHPDRFGRSTLWVAVEGSAWAQELRMMKDRILSKLDEISGEPGLFKDVRFGVRPLPTREPLPAPVVPVVKDEKPVEQLTIREIAERRLAKWKDAGAD